MVDSDIWQWNSNQVFKGLLLERIIDMSNGLMHLITTKIELICEVSTKRYYRMEKFPHHKTVVDTRSNEPKNRLKGICLTLTEYI